MRAPSTHVIFLAGEVTQTLAFDLHSHSIAPQSGSEKAIPTIHKVFGILSRSSKVDQGDFVV